MKDDIQIYVACLAAYNNGILHGRWIDATQDDEDIWKEIRAMLKSSPIPGAEEWAIHDYEGFYDIGVAEYDSIEDVAAKARFIDEHGEMGAGILSHCNEDLDEAKEKLENNYAGEFESIADYAREITEQFTEVPENLQYYIDYEAMARDMELNGEITPIHKREGKGVHLFW